MILNYMGWMGIGLVVGLVTTAVGNKRGLDAGNGAPTNVGIGLLGGATCGWIFNLLSGFGATGVDGWSVLAGAVGATAFVLVWHEMRDWPDTVNGARDGTRSRGGVVISKLPPHPLLNLGGDLKPSSDGAR
jgi:uncharacterized membrane protein YeaQ/YmgE (transglycosylase-associated protein family)